MATKTDFEASARIFKIALESQRAEFDGSRFEHSEFVERAIEFLALQFADQYGRENVRFDRARFLRACTVSLS